MNACTIVPSQPLGEMPPALLLPYGATGGDFWGCLLLQILRSNCKASYGRHTCTADSQQDRAMLLLDGRRAKALSGEAHSLRERRLLMFAIQLQT